WFIR
ncbi:MATE efflux family protein, partial [Vibrio parahaemolyticus V-223/04]